MENRRRRCLATVSWGKERVVSVCGTKQWYVVKFQASVHHLPKRSAPNYNQYPPPLQYVSPWPLCFGYLIVTSGEISFFSNNNEIDMAPGIKSHVCVNIYLLKKEAVAHFGIVQHEHQIGAMSEASKTKVQDWTFLRGIRNLFVASFFRRSVGDE